MLMGTASRGAMKQERGNEECGVAIYVFFSSEEWKYTEEELVL